MYDKALDLFLAAADCGSFTKAAEQFFLTHTAVIKQMNGLEERLGVQLFVRTSRGVSLTAAGEAFREEAKKLIAQSESAVKRVRQAAELFRKALRVGSSPLSPCQPFLQEWQDAPELSRFRFQVVPFSDDRGRYGHLGRKFDFLIGPCDNAAMQEHIRFFPLGHYHFCILMRRDHPLAGERFLTFQALRGQQLAHIRAGTSPVNDALRNALTTQYPDITLVDVPPVFNMDTFNRCAQEGTPLIAPDCWAAVHPMLTAVPLQEDFLLPYGIVTSEPPGEAMEELLQTLEERL